MASDCGSAQTVFMKNARIKVAAAGLFAVLSMLAVAHGTAAAASASAMRYSCVPAQNLVVRRHGNTATVHFIDRTYELRRSASSMGEKFLSPHAALIIEGKSAVFVAEDRMQLGTCVEAMRILPRSSALR